MNAKQLAAIKRFTTIVDNSNRYTISDEYLNGNISWDVRPLHDGKTVMLCGSNTESLKWFETHIHVIAFVGVRGGVQVKTSRGIAF